MTSPTPGDNRRRRADIHKEGLYKLLGELVKKPVRAIFEYVDNSRDAKATRVVIVLDPEAVDIYDNGSGMVPDMTDEEYDFLQAYKEDIQEDGIKYDVRDLIPGSGGSSFTWCMECIGYSKKQPTTEDEVTGMRGIGMLAFRVIGNKPVWRSKPSRRLAEQYYGADSLEAKDPPIGILIAPTAKALDTGRGEYDNLTIDRVRIFKDPFGVTYDSGTHIRITELVDGVERNLRPQILTEELKKRYGADIRLGKLSITIIDRMTVQGKKTPGGLVIEVPPIDYKGIKIFDGKGVVNDVEFKAQLFYDPSGRNGYVAFQRRGLDDTESVTVHLPELSFDPLNTGKVSGFIQLPELPEAVFPLTATKMAPVASRAADAYVKVIQDWKTHLLAEIEKIDSKSRDQSTKDAMKNLSETASKAASQIPVLRNILGMLVMTREGKSRAGTIRGSGESNDITVDVFDEYGRPLPGIKVFCVMPGGLTLPGETGQGGGYNFGKLVPGRKVIKVELPQGMKFLDGISEYTANTTEDSPGNRSVFKIVTGKPPQAQTEVEKEKGRNGSTGKVETSGITEIRILQRTMTDPNQLYDIRYFDRGTIEINILSHDLRRAIENLNDQLRDALIASYSAAAIVEALLPADERSQIAALLTGKMLAELASNAKK